MNKTISLREVAVTGMGVISPNGCGLKTFWDACVNGQSGVRKLTTIDTTGLDVVIGGEALDFKREDYMERAVFRKIERFTQMAIAATKMALEDASFDMSRYNPDRVGVVIGTGVGAMIFSTKQIKRYLEGGPKRVQAQSVPRLCPHASTSWIAKVCGLHGMNYAVSTACSSGANAIGQAMWFVRHGIMDACLAGGSEESICQVGIAGFQELRALTRRNDEPEKASRPFDRDRDGFVMAEGAGMLVLEPLSVARERDARIYAMAAGFGSNCSGHDMVAPKPDGSDAALVMQQALADGNTNADEVDYVNAHGTSTVFNDVAETKAIKLALGERAKEIAVSSTKSLIGHTIGAAGAIEAIASILSIDTGIIHPTINLDNPDKECDLDYVPKEARKQKVRAAISNSFGFGSNNTALLFKAPE